MTLPVLVLAPRRRLPLLTREFVEVMTTDAAQIAVATAGYVDRRVGRRPLAEDATRLIGAIWRAGPDTTLPDLPRLAAAMADADRLTLTFRFEDDGTTLVAA